MEIKDEEKIMTDRKGGRKEEKGNKENEERRKG